jgi:hypothetical protein
MMPAHEVDAMAAIARADVDGFSMRGQRCGNGRIGGIASCGGGGVGTTAIACCTGAGGVGDGAAWRVTGTVRTDFGKSANSCVTDSGRVNESAFRVASIGCGGDCALGQN